MLALLINVKWFAIYYIMLLRQLKMPMQRCWFLCALAPFCAEEHKKGHFSVVPCSSAEKRTEKTFSDAEQYGKGRGKVFSALGGGRVYIYARTFYAIGMALNRYQVKWGWNILRNNDTLWKLKDDASTYNRCSLQQTRAKRRGKLQFKCHIGGQKNFWLWNKAVFRNISILPKKYNLLIPSQRN